MHEGPQLLVARTNGSSFEVGGLRETGHSLPSQCVGVSSKVVDRVVSHQNRCRAIKQLYAIAKG